MNYLNNLANTRFWNRYGLTAMWGVALFCLLIAIGLIGYSIYTQTNIKKSNYQPQKVQAVRVNQGPSYRINDVVKANLLGDPNPKPIVKETPKTSLDLTLKGILWSSDATIARAIIINGKRKAELYSVGEDIKGAGASVKEINSDGVLLNRGGATESLALNKKTISVGEPIAYDNPRGNAGVIDTFENYDSLDDQPGYPVKQPDLSRLDRALQRMGDL